MKSLKMMVLALFAAVLLCGCGDNALTYVEENAEWVVYGNTEQIFKNKLWEIACDNDQFKDLRENFRDFCNLDFEDVDGNIAIWGSFGSSKKPEPKVDGAVVILNKRNAQKIFEEFQDFAEKESRSGSYIRQTVDETEIDGCDAFVITKQVKNMDTGAWNEAEVTVTVVLVSNNVIQIFPQQKPDSLWKAKGNSDLAKQISEDAIIASAVSGDLLRKTLKRELDDVPEIGDVVIQVKGNNKKLVIEGSIDISTIEKD